jgi:hypothetical protein
MPNETFQRVSGVIRALRQAGKAPSSVELRPDGTILVLTDAPVATPMSAERHGDVIWLDEVGDNGKKKRTHRA